MKKIIAMALAAVLALGCFAGCTKSEDGFDTSKEIGVVSREEGSGTRGAFIELFGIEQKDENGNKIDYTIDTAAVTEKTSVMMTTVAGDPYAIGYISLGSLNDTVKALKIDGAEASVESVKAGSYKVTRPFNIVTGANLSEVAQDFINYILSADGQKIIEDYGCVSVVEGEAYTASGLSGKIVVSGSSSVTPVMQDLKEAYIALNPNVKIEIQTSDSTSGVTDTIDGTCDIGMASRDLKGSEVESGVTATVIATDGIAVIVNNESPLEGLTSEQVKAIYTGEVTTWAEVIGE